MSSLNFISPVLARRLGWLLLPLSLGAAWAATPAASPGAAGEKKKAVGPIALKSVFNADFSTGIDPFFPKSDRRPRPVIPTLPSTLPDPAPAPAPLFPRQITLQGISIALNKKLALINGRTFAVGEDAVIKIDGEVLRVHCDEIRERSVIVTVKGMTKEIRLRDGL